MQGSCAGRGPERMQRVSRSQQHGHDDVKWNDGRDAGGWTDARRLERDALRLVQQKHITIPRRESDAAFLQRRHRQQFVQHRLDGRQRDRLDAGLSQRLICVDRSAVRRGANAV